MAVCQQVFKRYEKKFLLTAGQHHKLEEMLKDKMQRDAYGLYTIYNLYYDTEQFDIIRASLEKPVYKEKLRLRSYGIPEKDGRVFLELKKKFEGIVYKRREAMALDQAESFLRDPKAYPDQTQILKEIGWFIKNNPVSPKAFIGYDRIALFGREDPELRITFDRNIRWRDTDLDLRKGDWGQRILPEDTVLMELKIHHAIPIWLCHILEECHAEMASFSKYGACYTNNLRFKTGKDEICA